MKDEAGVAILRCRPPVKLNFIYLSFSTRQRLQELRMAKNDIFQFFRVSSFLLRKGSRRTWQCFFLLLTFIYDYIYIDQEYTNWLTTPMPTPRPIASCINHFDVSRQTPHTHGCVYDQPTNFQSLARLFPFAMNFGSITARISATKAAIDCLLLALSMLAC